MDKLIVVRHILCVDLSRNLGSFLSQFMIYSVLFRRYCSRARFSEVAYTVFYVYKLQYFGNVQHCYWIKFLVFFFLIIYSYMCRCLIAGFIIVCMFFGGGHWCGRLTDIFVEIELFHRLFLLCLGVLDTCLLWKSLCLFYCLLLLGHSFC